MKIILITTGQPSLNPRIVKEADSLIDAGYDVTVFYQYWNDWGTELDKALLKTKKWKAIKIGSDPFTSGLIFYISKLKHKIITILSKNFSLKYGFAEKAICRSNQIFLNKLLVIKADLYIAHNLGALPIAVLASKKNNSKCGFDAEDFHRQEISDDQYSKPYKLVKFIEDKYLPHVNYLSCASPLIAKAYTELYPNLKATVINNVFSVKHLQPVIPTIGNHLLKLFWFSQTVGKNRGLEDAIRAIGILKKQHITLTLLGNVDEINKNYFLEMACKFGLNRNQLIFIKPMAPDQIFLLANKHDIGLALEPGFCLNNKIALSNKIFTYLSSGLVIIASETLMQKKFLEQYSLIGKSYPIGNIEVLCDIIDSYDKNRDFLHKTKLKSHYLAKENLNWEIESVKFLDIIKHTLAF